MSRITESICQESLRVYVKNHWRRVGVKSQNEVSIKNHWRRAGVKNRWRIIGVKNQTRSGQKNDDCTKTPKKTCWLTMLTAAISQRNKYVKLRLAKYTYFASFIQKLTILTWSIRLSTALYRAVQPAWVLWITKSHLLSHTSRNCVMDFKYQHLLWSL